jgi:hypothetical protein
VQIFASDVLKVFGVEEKLNRAVAAAFRLILNDISFSAVYFARSVENDFSFA